MKANKMTFDVANRFAFAVERLTPKVTSCEVTAQDVKDFEIAIKPELSKHARHGRIFRLLASAALGVAIGATVGFFVGGGLPGAAIGGAIGLVVGLGIGYKGGDKLTMWRHPLSAMQRDATRVRLGVEKKKAQDEAKSAQDVSRPRPRSRGRLQDD